MHAQGKQHRINCAGKHQARMETVIESGTISFKILWTCGETGTRNGQWCDARGDEWDEKARKANNKMAGQCEQHNRTFHQLHEMGRQRSRQMEKCYRGCRGTCRQGSDTR